MSTTQAMTGQRGQRLPRSARRAQLLEAAQAVFATAGYHAAAMDDIADRAGVSKPVLYQHFPGKLDLYLALLDQHCTTLESLVRDALHTPAESAKSKVFAAIEAYFDFVAREDAAFRMVFESDLTSEPRVRERIDAVTDTCAEAIAEAIVEDTAGGLDDEQALLMAVGLAGLSQVSARHWLAQGAALPKEVAARLVGQLAWRGVTGFPTGHAEDALPRPSGEEGDDTAG
ncbi:TetR family transcriptional regulator [Nostocoides sp. F2B08]|uniref:TetR/AcrR family transcriptional regulator n=1 Tax=Nostocoides sp. F2B08 TaxID=2653936 RepID=UPI0012634A77|nr:TetR/AcrR family transcriptional regulator [Tetrasphaera sp. F2B08]KAB7746218.1 TetR family transcriptional regulator [Tetrasphaera sp. F2B08]